MLPAVISSIGDKIWSTGQTVGQNILDRGISKVTDKIGNAIFGKPDGIPAPMTGTEAGQFRKDYMDTAFPDTTPWERLGSNSDGAVQQATQMNAKMQERTVDKQLNNQKNIAENTNRASIISSLGQFGPEGIEYGLDKYSTSIGTENGFDTAISLNKQKLPYEIQKLGAEKSKIIMEETESYQRALKTASEADQERVKAEYIRSLQEAGLNEAQSRTVLNWANSARSAVGVGTDIYDRTPMGITRRPPRFQIDVNTLMKGVKRGK